MPTATFKGVKIADADTTVVVEGNHYFPPDSVNKQYLKTSTTTYNCPWKGHCEYYDATMGGTVQRDIAWYYANPYPKAANIKGYVAFDRGQVKIEL